MTQMGSAESFARGFADAVAEVAVVLDERARRLLLGAAARQIGRGGPRWSRERRGSAGHGRSGRGGAGGGGRRGQASAGAGAGRKSVEETDPRLWPALEKLVDPETRADPMSELRWTTKSTVKRLFRKWSAGEGVTGPGVGVVSLR